MTTKKSKTKEPDLLAELRSASEDPLAALLIVAKYQRLLNEVSRQAVSTARQLGKSWDEIAGAVGTSRQSAWQRYRRSSPPADSVPLVMRRFPNRRRRHLALRDAITADYGITISERSARELSSQIDSRRVGSSDSIFGDPVVLTGRDPETGERTSKTVSCDRLAHYFHPVPGRSPSHRRPAQSPTKWASQQP
jgi:hypothetical protein